MSSVNCLSVSAPCQFVSTLATTTASTPGVQALDLASKGSTLYLFIPLANLKHTSQQVYYLLWERTLYYNWMTIRISDNMQIIKGKQSNCLLLANHVVQLCTLVYTNRQHTQGNCYSETVV